MLTQPDRPDHEDRPSQPAGTSPTRPDDFSPPPTSAPPRVGVLTSGGDAPGMNAAVRAVVRATMRLGGVPYAITEGWLGAVEGGAHVRELEWEDVGSILERGGTVIGTARSSAFRERDGLRAAAVNLARNGIDRLCVIGGDGSLTGAELLRQEWPGLLAEAVERDDLPAEVAARHPRLRVVGLAATIDNDLVGTDMTIGTDSALHRVVGALDDLASTAASHQRTFVVEVMGRTCGYLPLMSAVAGGADYVLTPEDPPGEGWVEHMCTSLHAGRGAGRRDSIVVVAEGTHDADGEPLGAERVAELIGERMGEDARVTILGHVQRGGAPSAYDRWMPTLLGCAAAQELLREEDGGELPSVVLAVRRNRVTALDLTTAVADTRAVGDLVAAGDGRAAAEARGRSFVEMSEVFETLSTPPGATAGEEATGEGTAGEGTADARGEAPASGGARGGDDADGEVAASGGARTGGALRVAIMHAGGLAPGMNTVARTLVRLGAARGWQMLGVRGGFPGLVAGDLAPLSWAEVDSWVGEGGANLGTSRRMPAGADLYRIARVVEDRGIDAIVLAGGMNAYEGAQLLAADRHRLPALDLPVVCLPTSIDNNLPGSELSVGADTAVNSVVGVLDAVRRSASASRRCFVAETMGRRCGYLALMSAISSGAERVHLHEDGLTLAELAQDAAAMRASFGSGRRLYLVVRNEEASDYDTTFLEKVFTQESAGLFDVRTQIIGHLQQGGIPTPFDRILAVRLAHRAVTEVAEMLARAGAGAGAGGDAGAGVGSGVGSGTGTHGEAPRYRFVGQVDGQIAAHDLADFDSLMDMVDRRPKDQWWTALSPLVGAVSSPGHSVEMPTIPVATV